MGIISASLFFEQLRQFSERIFELMEIGERRSPWSSGRFRREQPTGAIIHYTGSNKASHAVRWFMETRYQSKVSAHVVVLDCWPLPWRSLATGLPMVQDLPTAVIQCLPPTRIAHHAGRSNTRCYGLELVNAGELRLHEGNWVYWRNDFTEPWISQKKPVLLYGRYWEPYPLAQVITTVQLLRYLRCFAPRFDPDYVLGHENVTQPKMDPGPLFPLHDVRTAVLEKLDPMLYYWAQQYAVNKHYMIHFREAIALEWYEHKPSVGIDVDRSRVVQAWKVLKKALFAQKVFGSIGKAGLRILGFPTSELTNDQLRELDVASIKRFQRLMGLVIDGKPGSKTREALVARINVLRYWPED